jgi:hypothetical protein
MSYKIFKVVKFGQRTKNISLFPYGFQNLGLARASASLEFASSFNSCEDIIVKDENGSTVFKANANRGGVVESYIETFRGLVDKK